MANETPELIFEVATGFMAAKYLFVANEVGLFEKLAEGPATLDELTERIGIPRRTTRIIADAVVALGFVELQGDRYQNGTVADSFQSGGNTTDLRSFLRYFNHLVYPTWILSSRKRTNGFSLKELKHLQPGKLVRWPRIMTSASIARCWISAAARVRF
jgi:hypothetical protein